MPYTGSGFWKFVGAAGMLAALAAWPGIGQAQTGLVGQASGVTAVVLGNVSSLADTGTLTDASQPLGTGQATGSISGLISAETLHAATMGWTDQVASEASLANLVMTVAGTGISADFVMSRAMAVSGAGSTALSAIEGLRVGGVAIAPGGAPNQTISLPGLSIVLNEQIATTSGMVVNALRVRTLDGLTDVAIASSRAGI